MPKIKKRGYGAKQPEQQIVTMANMVSGYFAKYRKRITAAAIIIVGVVVLFGGYSYMRAQQERKAEPLVSEAYGYYNPSNDTPPDYQKALELFRSVAKDYAGTMSGAMARYYAGNCLVSMGRPEDALKEYQQGVQSSGGDNFMRGLVYQRMGYVYAGLGKKDDERKSFEQAESLLGPGVATVELARLYEESGNKPEAEKKYKVVLDKLVGTSWAAEAMSKVQKIAPARKPAATKKETAK